MPHPLKRRSGWFDIKINSGNHSSGGCQPALTQRFRALTTVELFIFNTSIVARPQDDNPVILVLLSSQLKCSFQF